MNALTAERSANPVVVFNEQLKAREQEFKAALPAHMPVDRFMRVVLTAVQNNPELLEVDRRSFFNGCMRAAQDGLLPDGREGALVVRRDNKVRAGKSANWQPMIAGIRKKARNSGEITTWDAHIVRAGDHFQFQLGDNPQVNHTYDLQTERGEIIGAYSVCVLKDGQKSYEVMSISEIHAIRDRSDAWKAFKAGKIKTTPWFSDEGEMCRKTVARRHSKVIPMSTDLDDLIRRDDDLYDFKGAREEAADEARRPKLVAALDQLSSGGPIIENNAVQAGPEAEVNPETGEAAGEEGQAIEQKLDDPKADEQPTEAGQQEDEREPEFDPEDPDYQRGMSDRRKGSKKCIVNAILNDEARLANWRAGYAAADEELEAAA